MFISRRRRDTLYGVRIDAERCDEKRHASEREEQPRLITAAGH